MNSGNSNGLSFLDSYAQPANDSIDLGDGYEATTVTLIQRKKPYSKGELAQLNLLNNGWKPKGSQMTLPQRCPFISVDSFCFLYNQEMMARGAEPCLILGVWDKEVLLYGVKQRVKGLVVASGGHFERMGNKNNDWQLKFEAGDTSLRAAADKEISEEIGVDKSKCRLTVPFGFIDDPLAEPRAHYLRCIFLRWIDQSPMNSEELQHILAVPLSSLQKLCDGEISWVHPGTKEELRLELNHDTMIRLVMKHPTTRAFLNRMVNLVKSSSKVQTGKDSGSSSSSGASSPTLGDLDYSAPPSYNAS